MPDVLVVIAIIIMFICTLVSFICWCDKTMDEPWFILSFIPLMILSGWMLVYNQLPLEVESTYIVTSTKVDNVDVIIMNTRPINLNDVLKRNVNSGSKVKVTEYKNNYVTSCGISTTGHNPPKFEVIEGVEDGS